MLVYLDFPALDGLKRSDIHFNDGHEGTNSTDLELALSVSEKEAYLQY